jgi:hypothetical protein
MDNLKIVFKGKLEHMSEVQKCMSNIVKMFEGLPPFYNGSYINYGENITHSIEGKLYFSKNVFLWFRMMVNNNDMCSWQISQMHKKWEIYKENDSPLDNAVQELKVLFDK